MSKQGTILKCEYGEASDYLPTNPAILFNRIVIINNQVYKWFGCNPHEVDFSHNGPHADDVVMLQTERLREYDEKTVLASNQRQFGVEFKIDDFCGKMITLTPRQIYKVLGEHPLPRWLRLFTLECMLDLELDLFNEDKNNDSIPPPLSYFGDDKHKKQFEFQRQLVYHANSVDGLPTDDSFGGGASSAVLTLLEHAGQAIVEVKGLAGFYDEKVRRSRTQDAARRRHGTKLEVAQARLASRNDVSAEILSCGTDWAMENHQLQSIATTVQEEGWTTEKIASEMQSAARSSAINALSIRDFDNALRESCGQAARGHGNRLHADVLSSYLSRTTAPTLQSLGDLVTAVSRATYLCSV